MTISEENSKTYATLSYAVVMLLVGLPVWWQTTDVERAPLPFDRIDEMSKDTLKQVVPITIASTSLEQLDSFEDIASCSTGIHTYCLFCSVSIRHPKFSDKAFLHPMF